MQQEILINQRPILRARSLGEKQTPLILIQKKILPQIHPITVMTQIFLLHHR